MKRANERKRSKCNIENRLNELLKKGLRRRSHASPTKTKAKEQFSTFKIFHVLTSNDERRWCGRHRRRRFYNYKENVFLANIELKICLPFARFTSSIEKFRAKMRNENDVGTDKRISSYKWKRIKFVDGLWISMQMKSNNFRSKMEI